MPFRKYQHIERFGTEGVLNIELGENYVFPKIDGTNASVWLEDGELRCGSRNRELSLDNDNAGFMAFAISNGPVRDFLVSNPNLRLYGEWLVPHSLKTYRDAAWRKFYVFDVYCEDDPLHYTEYQPLLEQHGVEYIPPIAIVKNMTYEGLVGYLEEKNNYLIKDGEGFGEGVVVKNYEYTNRRGDRKWAKIVTAEFKEKAHKAMGAPLVNGVKMAEQEIVDQWCTGALIEKTFAKIRNEEDGWTSRKIPKLLSCVYYDLITEEMWDITKGLKNPTVNFKTLQHLVQMKIKSELPEVFGYPRIVVQKEEPCQNTAEA